MGLDGGMEGSGDNPDFWTGALSLEIQMHGSLSYPRLPGTFGAPSPLGTRGEAVCVCWLLCLLAPEVCYLFTPPPPSPSRAKRCSLTCFPKSPLILPPLHCNFHSSLPLQVGRPQSGVSHTSRLGCTGCFGRGWGQGTAGARSRAPLCTLCNLLSKSVK